MQPSRTNVNKKIEGHKTAKDRLTLVLCCNITGTLKLSLYIVGRYENPHRLKNVNREDLPVTYRNNKSAWMITFNFQGICLELDNHCQLYGKQGVLFCDNAFSHSLGSMELHFLKVIYLSPTTTTALQTLDAGLFGALKRSTVICY
ncbi:hypothetical protein GEMRC1_005948 [Eukaryota sp. GEM-RC1]